jgi:hypothetical protein
LEKQSAQTRIFFARDVYNFFFQTSNMAAVFALVNLRFGLVMPLETLLNIMFNTFVPFLRVCIGVQLGTPHFQGARSSPNPVQSGTHSKLAPVPYAQQQACLLP